MTYPLYNDQNCYGYSDKEMAALNDEFAAICEAEGLEQGTDEFHERAGAFCDDVASRY